MESLSKTPKEARDFTQLCMEFATISDQVGSLESKRRNGGMTFFVFGRSLDREATDMLFCMYLNS